MQHAYPEDFATFLSEQWHEACEAALPDGEIADPLPPPAVLARILAVAYHASFLQNELRPLRFRAIVREPSRFPRGSGPPHGLHTLLFTELRLFDESLIRQLAMASDYSRALLGVGMSGSRPVIWGLVRSGSRWLRDTYGRAVASPLPQSLILHVLGPGWLVAGLGDVVVGELRNGVMRRESMSVFESSWLPDTFAPAGQELVALHTADRTRQREPWAALDENLVGRVAQNMFRRCIAAVQADQHGGTLVIVPPHRVVDILGQTDYVDLRFAFADDEPRRRFRTLILEVMRALAVAEGRRGRQLAGWHEYEESTDDALEAVDEAIFEVARLFADLTAVDGAVIMTQRFEILGFGAEISARLPPVDLVARSLDLDCARFVLESTDHVGTRHRSAFRLARAMPDAIIVVVSQDGGVRFVRWHEGRVTYWDHASL